jgi:hypothetical protein
MGRRDASVYDRSAPVRATKSSGRPDMSEYTARASCAGLLAAVFAA